MRQASAFCPGHITGFFQICRHENVLETGSRGAGFCVRLGAQSRVVLKDGTGKVEVKINGARAKAHVTERAVRHLLGEERLDVDVFTTLQLPVSQGFGMSAAGALSSAMALTELLGLGEEEAYTAAHIAEVESGTGLGDVAALQCTGVTYRKKEGLPPFGEVQRIPGDFDMVLARVGPSIDTSSVILDPERSAAINRAGEECLGRFAKKKDLYNLLDLAVDFTASSGLLTERVRKALISIDGLGLGSMCMVGNSVFAAGPDLDGLDRQLRRFGLTFRTSVDLEGARLL
jgi:pantoate kinase